MLISEIMSAPVQIASRSTPLFEVARVMSDLDVGAIPVCDSGRLIGMITDRDIVVRAVSRMADLPNTPADAVMSSPPIYCFEDQKVDEAARLMKTQQVRRIVVLNRKMQIAGIVSLGDLAVMTQDERLGGEVLERVSEPVEIRSEKRVQTGAA